MRRALRIAIRAARVVVLVLAGVVALVVALVLTARTNAGRAWIREVALDKARQTVPGLDFSRLRGDLVRDIVLDDVVVVDGAGRRALAARRIAVRYDLLALLRRTVHVRELRIDGPVVLGRVDADGALNLAHLARAQPAAPRPAAPATTPEPSRWRVVLDRLRVDAGAADLATREGASILVSDLSLDATGSWQAGGAGATVRRLEAAVERDGQTLGFALAGDARVGPEAIAAHLARLRLTGLLPDDAIDLSATVAGPPSRLAVEATARAGNAGEATLRGTLESGAAGLGAYDLALQTSPLALARLASALPEGRVALAATARGHGVPLAPGSRATLAIRAPAARVAGVAVHEARVDAGCDGDRWWITRAAVRASGATLALAARGEGPRLTGDVDVQVNGALPEPHATRDHHRPPPDVRGHGHLTAHVAGVLPRQVEVTAHVAARDVSTGRFRLGGLELDGQLSATRTSLRGALRLAARGVVLGARGPHLDVVSLDASSEAGVVHLRGSATGPRLRAAVALHGPLSPRRAQITVDQLSLAVETRAYKQSLALQAPVTVDYAAGDRITLTPVRLRGVGYLLTGAVAAEGTYSLAPAAHGPQGSLDLTLAHASLGGLDSVDATVRATLEERRAKATLDATVARGHVQLTADLPVLPRKRGLPQLAPRGALAVHLAARRLSVVDLPGLAGPVRRMGIAEGTLEATLDATGDAARPTATGTLQIGGLAVRSLGRDPWQGRGELRDLAVAARLDAAADGVHVTATAARRGADILRVDAHADTDLGRLLSGARLPDVPVRASADVPALDLAIAGELGPALRGVKGTLTGHAEAGGTLAHPTARADVRVKSAAVDQVAFREVLVHGDLRTDGGAGGDRVVEANGAVSLPQIGGGALYAEAHLRDGRAGALRARLGAQNVDIAFLRPFLPGMRELGGTLQATVVASGTPAAPELRAEVALSKGRIGVIGQPTFQDVKVAATLRPGHADLGELSMKSGRGTLTVHGSAEMDGVRPQAVTLTAHASDFLVSASGEPARIDGELAAEGALREAVLAGKVRVPHAVIRLPSIRPGGGRNLQDVRPRPDIRFVDPAALAEAERRARRAASPSSPPTRLDVSAEADPVFVRSKDFDLELESRLQIGTAPPDARVPSGATTLAGTVRIRRGHVNLAGQRYEVERGQISLDGSPEPNPGLDLRLTHRFPDATVVIELGGTVKHPDLRLSSDPPIYEQAQILSLILTGQTTAPPGAAPTVATGAPGVGGLPMDATAAVASMVLGRLADTLAPELGLDVLQVQNVEMKTAGGVPTGLTDTRVEVGKYVTERIYISYAHIFGAPDTSNANEARIEYRLTRRWVIQTIFGDAGAGSIDALWTYRH